jgi:DNA-directed RNA polymerase subunit RPC12/RpoP
MKCMRCKMRGDDTEMILRQQQGQKEVYMVCPKCSWHPQAHNRRESIEIRRKEDNGNYA